MQKPIQSMSHDRSRLRVIELIFQVGRFFPPSTSVSCDWSWSACVVVCDKLRRWETRCRRRKFKEKSSPRERDLQRRLLNTQLMKNHSNVFFVEFVITIQQYWGRNTHFFPVKTHKKKQDKEHETGCLKSAATNYVSTREDEDDNKLFNQLPSEKISTVQYFSCNMVLFFLDASADSRFEISRKGVYDPYVLSIVNLNSTDDGGYYCCLASNCSSNIEGICESIRLFVIGKSYILQNTSYLNSLTF